MVVRVNSPIKINQCLFGYDDGHRLIKSSLTLPYQSSSLLLLLSDLAKGVTFELSDHYWTGFPLSGDKTYALLKTWAAPEMRRPGCVWTQVLLITFTDLARISDLKLLKSLFKRPALKNFSTYGEELTFYPLELSTYTPNQEHLKLKDIHNLLNYVYDQKITSIYDIESVDVDAWFDIWSQQWPKARRDFTFRTAGQFSGEFSLNFINPFEPWDFLNNSDEEWLDIASKDIYMSGNFRKFLWRYASDLESGKRYFKLLAHLYKISRTVRFSQSNLTEFLYLISLAFPDPSEAGVIKEDIANLGTSAYSRLPEIKAIDLVDFYITHPSSTSFPILSESVLLELEEEWEAIYFELLTLTEKAIRNKSQWARLLLIIVTKKLTSQQFWQSAVKLTGIRQEILNKRPELLIEGDISQLNLEDIITSIQKIKLSTIKLEKFLYKLLKLDRRPITELLLYKYPRQTLKLITKEFIEHLEKGNVANSSHYTSLIKNNMVDIVDYGYLELSNKSSTLYAFLQLFGLYNHELENLGSLPWAKALSNVENDLEGAGQSTFYTYLLMLALKQPSKGCEVIFEEAFVPIHNLLWHMQLNREALDLIFLSLPQVEHVPDWDLCKRLRKSLTMIYVSAGLSVASLNRQTNLKELLTTESIALKPKDKPKVKTTKLKKKKKRRFGIFSKWLED